MVPTKDLTPAQQREARRKLHRILGDGTPEEQMRRVLGRAFDQASKQRKRQAVRTLVNGIGQIIVDVLERRRRP